MSQQALRDTLRHHYRNLRRSLSPAQQSLAAQQLLKQCLTYPPFVQAKNVACYLKNDGEIDTKQLIEYSWRQAKKVLLPVIDPSQSGHLVFVEHQANWPLTANKYGIAEPQYTEDKILKLTAIDIIFTPLVAFDKQGNRLGMGGGYYDRTLVPLTARNNTTLVIGLAHDCQQVASLPIQAWDIPLHGIITPSQIITLNGSV